MRATTQKGSGEKKTKKNWETKRKYLEIDELRDSITVGGNARLTFFDNHFELIS